MVSFITYVFSTEIIIIFNCYVVTATELTTFVLLYSCNNNITLKMVAERPKQVGENLVNNIHHKYCSAFCLLFMYFGSD